MFNKSRPENSACKYWRNPSGSGILRNSKFWRDGRAVECTGLENQRGFVALPGFESLSLRQIKSPASCGAFYLVKCTGFGENSRFDRSAGADLDVAIGNARRVSARDGANQSPPAIRRHYISTISASCGAFYWLCPNYVLVLFWLSLAIRPVGAAPRREFGPGRASYRSNPSPAIKRSGRSGFS